MGIRSPVGFCIRLLSVVVLALLGAFVGDVGPWTPHWGLVEGHRPDCHEYHTDYSQQCWAQSVRCGNFCFYPKCHDCTPYRHCHCSLLGGCNCHTQRNPGISPCTDWRYYLYGEPDGARLWTFQSPNVVPTSVFGGPHAVEGAFEPPVETDCVEEGKDPEFTTVPDLSDPTWEAWSGVEKDEDLELGDLVNVPVVDGWDWWSMVPGAERVVNLLVEVPGQAGAPLLDRVLVGEGRVVELEASGYAGVLEYRWWSYNGFVPGEVRRPFVRYGGAFVVPGKGLHVFQVRARSGGEPTGWSNVKYALLDFEEDLDSLPIPKWLVPPETATPMPTPVAGVRPEAAVLVSVVEVEERPGWVVVTMAEDYEESLEYRVWPHSGFQPGPVDPAITLAEPIPFIQDRQKFWAAVEERSGVEVFIGEIEVPMAWYFEVRRVGQDGLVSEPSNTLFEMFWHEPAGGWLEWVGRAGG